MIINAKIVGIKVALPDEIKRKEILESCRKGELLTLKREQENPHDPDAIAVFRQSSEKIGYLNKDAAAKLAPDMDKSGKNIEAVLAEIEGGKPGFFPALFGAKEQPIELNMVINTVFK